ncbi:MAG: leucine-rich repeat domain-containing protein [Jannaschia helgolandensis]|uniref:leucine-rich repeat domain-containing protein n=1 Tax=Jannaschia helgolandensis TaxID=188906 RepID=UPI003C72AF09
MANEDRDEALRRIEKARETGATTLDLSGLKIDTLPPKIADLTNLQTLFLGNTQVTDLSPIASLTNLQRLSLGNTQVTDLSHIADLTNLHLLDLDNTQVADLSPIAGLTNLQLLSLNNTQVTDLSPIADLTNLQRLDLDNTQVTDLSHIAGLTNLQTLALDTTQVTDLSHVAGLTNLTWLNLGNTQVTDLRFLLDLSRLPHPDVPEKSRIVYFSDTPACNDPAIATAAEIEDDEDRLQALLAHLRTLPPWPEPLPVFGKRPAAPTVPSPVPAPLEVEVARTRLRVSNRIAETGQSAATFEAWQALREMLQDLDDLEPGIGNAMPRLAKALMRVEAALGMAPEMCKAINLGLHGNRVIALAEHAPEALMDEAASEVVAFAAALALHLERFPAWTDYRAAQPVPPAQDVADILPDLRTLLAELRASEAVDPAIPNSFGALIDVIRNASRSAGPKRSGRLRPQPCHWHCRLGA